MVEAVGAKPLLPPLRPPVRRVMLLQPSTIVNAKRTLVPVNRLKLNAMAPRRNIPKLLNRTYFNEWPRVSTKLFSLRLFDYSIIDAPHCDD